MATGNWAEYTEFKKYVVTGNVDLDTDVFKVLLAKSTSNAIASLGGASTYTSLTNEVDTGNNYTQGVGRSLVKSVSMSASNAVFGAANVVFTASGGNITSVMFAVIAKATGGSGTVQATDKLVCAVSLSSAAFTITSGNTLTIDMSADIFDIT